MFLPYETTLSLWFYARPEYKWEACPAPEIEPVDGAANAAAPASAGADDDKPGSGTPGGLPALRLVFKGMSWTAYPVFGMRLNPAFDAVSATRRQEDEQHRDDNLRDGRRVPHKPPEAKTE